MRPATFGPLVGVQDGALQRLVVVPALSHGVPDFGVDCRQVALHPLLLVLLTARMAHAPATNCLTAPFFVAGARLLFEEAGFGSILKIQSKWASNTSWFA